MKYWFLNHWSVWEVGGKLYLNEQLLTNMSKNGKNQRISTPKQKRTHFYYGKEYFPPGFTDPPPPSRLPCCVLQICIFTQINI